MARESGMSLHKLEIEFIQDTRPERLIPGFRSPEAFKRYARGTQVPSGEEKTGSPVAWALPLYEEFRREYQSPFFELMSLGKNRNEVVQFSHHLFMRRRILGGVPYNLSCPEGIVRIEFEREACWHTPEEVSALPSCSRLDALCLLLIAFLCNIGTTDEGRCARLCLEWFECWRRKQEVALVEQLMIHVLSERVPDFEPYLSTHLVQQGKALTLPPASSRGGPSACTISCAPSSDSAVPDAGPKKGFQETS